MQSIFVQILSGSWFRVLASRFEQLHDMPYIIRKIDGSYIFVLPPVVGRIDHSYRKKKSIQQLYGNLLDHIICFGIMNLNGYDVFHNWVIKIFQVTKIGHACIDMKFEPYNLIRDTTYMVRTKMKCPFNNRNIILSGKETNLELINVQRECVWRRHLEFSRVDEGW